MTAAVPPVLVPEPLRRPVGLLVAGAAITFAVLAARYAGTSEAGGVDTRVDAVVDPLGTAHRWLVRHVVAARLPVVGGRPRVRRVGDLSGARQAQARRAGCGRSGRYGRLHDAAQACAGPHDRWGVRVPERAHRRRDIVGTDCGPVGDQSSTAEPWRSARDTGGGSSGHRWWRRCGNDRFECALPHRHDRGLLHGRRGGLRRGAGAGPNDGASSLVGQTYGTNLSRRKARRTAPPARR